MLGDMIFWWFQSRIISSKLTQLGSWYGSTADMAQQLIRAYSWHGSTADSWHGSTADMAQQLIRLDSWHGLTVDTARQLIWLLDGVFLDNEFFLEIQGGDFVSWFWQRRNFDFGLLCKSGFLKVSMSFLTDDGLLRFGDLHVVITRICQLIWSSLDVVDRFGEIDFPLIFL